jgi:CRISPR-associated protein (TIGR03986 family)
MNPSHAFIIPEFRAAYAPYNFVPLPDQVVLAEKQPDHNTYHEGRYTGRIECTLTTASSLYVRCGYTPEQYAELSEKSYDKMTPEERNLRAQFFHLNDPNQPTIPGSSLRGMLRALVEIASFGKMEKVTDVPRFFFRAVAAQKEDPLAAIYKNQLRDVQAGHLIQRGNQWFIRPARTISGETFIKVREQDIPATLGLVRLNNSKYHLQTIEVSFTTRRLKPSQRSPQGRTVVDLIDKPGIHAENGWLVTSGNMLETGQSGQRSPRKNHVVVLAPGDTEFRIADGAVADYRNGLSDYQIEQFGSHGVLQDGRPVFFCKPLRGQTEITYFGHSPNFRLPYRFPGSQRAATPLDFVPDHLKDTGTVDIAEAMFGTVRRTKQADGQTQAIAGRLFVGDAHLVAGQGNVLFDAPITPQILGGPKPTTFQHYLTQPSATQVTLKHYASKPSEETLVRGHKLYWHKGEEPNIKLPDNQSNTNESQKTSIRPIKANTRFQFTIHFENLSKVELGVLLWVLEKAADDQYRLKLGMGKPLGMGAVKIESKIYTSNRQQRYSQLFAENTDTWADDESEFQDTKSCIDAFHTHVLNSDTQRIDDTLRIQCLLALLKWPGPDPATTRYLEIERDPSKPRIPAADMRGNKINEYKNRPVLPSPLQVIGSPVMPIPAQAEIQPTTQRSTTQPGQTSQSPQRSSSQIPDDGATFTGLVLERDESLILIEVPGFPRERVVATLPITAETPKWVAGKDKARVEVIGRRIKGDLTILTVKRAAPKPKS